ncbi:PREDICTED: ecto-ADP-ribosyltransferase 4 [Chinchilla lanigera]|uniref:NAD(P)(+)--arginine ADP-ribosyltransferase n=1 Tax=Chinchilla lanigera TaxID=34839 RepID=A0A8C2W1U5_CHILA|nr:PREDICTED: ecto-ADP-ribosyltransferase 4 [Chinchilla lanigera]
MRMMLRSGQLALLLLLCGLQTPTGCSKVTIKVNFDLAPDSFDDQYQGCSKQVMDELSRGDYFTEEIDAHKNYYGAWQKAHLNWLSQEKALPANMTTIHALALLVYTLNNHVRSDFSRAMANAARSPQQYKHSFHFKYLHYYLTSAIQLLRTKLSMTSDTLCYEVYHGMKDVHLAAKIGDTIRFGQFLSTSLLREEAQKFGTKTLFTISTCLGALVQDFSLRKEVLIPPYELFEVVNTSYHPKGDWMQLRSAGNLSTYNCQLLKGSSKKYISTPIVTASICFLASVIISSKSRV